MLNNYSSRCRHASAYINRCNVFNFEFYYNIFDTLSN